jgi:hypothetical protein
MGTEQRKGSRFLMDDNVTIVLRKEVTKIGKARDIGVEGLSFEHLYDESLCQEPLEREVDILVGGEFQLSKLPCKVVYDIPVKMPDAYQGFRTRIITKRCGVKFGALSEDQVTQLDSLIKTCATRIEDTVP